MTESLTAKTWLPFLIQILSLVLILGLWQGTVQLGLVNHLLVAAPSDLLSVSPGFAQEVVDRLGLTISETAAAFLLAGAVGVTLGFLIGSSEFAYRTLDPYVVLYNSFPKIAAFPVLVLTFGLGTGANTALGFLTGVSVILFNTIQARRGIESDLLNVSHSLGCTQMQTYRWVIIPYMVPVLFSTLRQGLIRTMGGVLEAELLVPVLGMGLMITNLSYAFKTAQLYFAVGLISIAMIVLNWLLLRWEKHLSSWRD